MPITHASPARLEAFSDGVIAVIITIMVLELKVPLHDGFAGFRAILPTIGLYALSFAFTGVYWVNHHHLIHRTEQADQRTLYANLFFLFWLSLLPFFTAYVLDKKMDSFSVLLYVVSMVLTGGSFGLLRYVIGRSPSTDRQAGARGRRGRAQTRHLIGDVSCRYRLQLSIPLCLTRHRRAGHGILGSTIGEGQASGALRRCPCRKTGRPGRRLDG